MPLYYRRWGITIHFSTDTHDFRKSLIFYVTEDHAVRLSCLLEYGLSLNSDTISCLKCTYNISYLPVGGYINSLISIILKSPSCSSLSIIYILNNKFIYKYVQNSSYKSVVLYTNQNKCWRYRNVTPVQRHKHIDAEQTINLYYKNLGLNTCILEMACIRYLLSIPSLLYTILVTDLESKLDSKFQY